MDNAELYNKNNALQKKDTLKCLNEFADIIKWKNYATIVDIGCGDGSTTSEILKQYIPGNFKLLIGGDLSEKMVKFAEKNHGGERTAFVRLDIEARLPRELAGHFDHAFSFYTFHWIQKQKVAFRNIYNLLSEEGSCLLLFLGHMPLYDVYRTLARRAKWSAYLNNVDRFTSPYHDSQEPEKEIQAILKEIGFKHIDVRKQEKSLSYQNLDVMEKSVKAVIPFDIPLDMWKEFFSDYVDVVRDFRMIDINNNSIKESINVRCDYTLLVVLASK